MQKQPQIAMLINVYTRANTAVKIEACQPDMIVFDKKSKLITIIENGITSFSQLLNIETGKET